MDESLVSQLLDETERASDQRVGWSYARWTDSLREQPSWVRDVLEVLEDSWATEKGISRTAVRLAGQGDPRRLLVASMVWGFGGLGYGPARTAKMLTTSELAHKLGFITDAARESPTNGFSALFHKRRPVIKGLSIAMGTKLLYFAASPQEDEVTPVVYDSVVAAALQELDPEVNAPNPAKRMDSVQYQVVCGWMADRATESCNGLMCDDVEYALFQYAMWNRRRTRLLVPQ